MSSQDRHTDDDKKPGASFGATMILHAWKRHPLLVFLALILSGSTAAAIWLYLPLPKKSAAMVFYISSQPQVVIAPTAETRTDYNAYKQVQIALLKSRTKTLLQTTKIKGVSDLPSIKNAQPDPVTWLDRNLNVDNRGGFEYLRVSLDGDDGDELITLLEAVSKAFISASDDQNNELRSKRTKELNDTLERINQDLTTFHKAIEDIAKVLRSKEPSTLAIYDMAREEKMRIAYNELVEANEEVDNQLAQVKSLEAQLKAVKKNQKTPAQNIAALFSALAAVARDADDHSLAIPPDLIDDEIDRDPKMQAFDAELLRLNSLISETQLKLDPAISTESPLVKKYKDEIAKLEEQRGRYAIEARGRVELILKSRIVEIMSRRVGDAQSQLDKLRARQIKAEKKFNFQKDENDKLSDHKLTLEKIRMESGFKEEMKNQIVRELELLNIEKKSQRRVEVVEPPYLITGIEGNRRLKYAILASIGVLLAGLVGIVVWEARHQRVLHVEEVSTGLGARLIGTMPPLEILGKSDADQEITTGLVEAIDTARTMLLHGTPGGAKMRVLTVTSATSGEGKTTLSGHLAISLTRAGFRTLLIDGDMQAPTAHRLFDLPASPGLSEVLRGEVNILQAVHASPIPGLSILPAGTWSMTTRQMLVGEKWKLLKRELETAFDFVVIDTSPLLQVTDTILLAREADGVILSVLVGVSQVPCVAQTVARLKAVGAELVGVVVNNVRNDVYRPKIYRQNSLSITRAALLKDTDTSISTARTNSKDIDETSENGIKFAEEYQDSK